MKKLTVAMFIAAFVATAAAAVPAIAQAEPATRFVSEGGYAPLDADEVWERINGALPGDPEAIFLPAAGLGPIPVALLALEASEPALERVRYRLRYGTDWVHASPGGAPQPLSYVEVVRFNLGPAIRQDLIDSLGNDAVADAEEFGIGPHVGWRIVTRPVMGNRAIVVAAGRMQVDEPDAREEACLGAPCLDAAPLIEGAAAWGDMEPGSAGPAGIAGDAMTAAGAVDLLLGKVDSIEADAEAGTPGIPGWAIEAVVEVNLGQDEGLDAAYRWGGLMDDSVTAIWQRLAAFGTGQEPATFRASASECGRGGGFAPPGGLCP
ncbi:hypothetical protein [Luteimonas sp. A478]